MAKTPPKKQKDMKRLTKLQANFVEEYLKSPTLDATECARRAGYSCKYPDRQAYLLLENNRVLRAIADARQKRALRTERSADEVLDLLWKMNEYSLEDYFDIDEAGEITAKRFDQLKPGAAKLINGIKFKKQALKKGAGDEEFLSISDIEYKMPNKDKMIELLMRHYGLFKKDNEQSGISEAMLVIILAGLPDEKARGAVKKNLIAYAKGKK